MPDRPATTRRCAAHLKDGSACRTHTTLGGSYCEYHARLLDNQPEADPGEVSPASTTVSDQPLSQPRTAHEPVGDIRARLARDVAEEYEVLRGALLDALKAEREAFATCPHCQHRHPIVVPDWTARVKAVETLLNQGFGREQPRAALTEEELRVKELIAEIEAKDPDQHHLDMLRFAINMVTSEATRWITDERERRMKTALQVGDYRKREAKVREAKQHRVAESEQIQASVQSQIIALMNLDEETSTALLDHLTPRRTRPSN